MDKAQIMWVILGMGPLRAQSLSSRSSQASGKDKETHYYDAARGVMGMPRKGGRWPAGARTMTGGDTQAGS